MGQRVGFYLTDLQIKTLKNISKGTGLTVSEIIRRAVDKHLEEYREIVVRYEEEKQRHKTAKVKVKEVK